MLLPKIAPRRGALPHRSTAIDADDTALLLTAPKGPVASDQATASDQFAEQSGAEQWVNLGGAPVKLMDFDKAVSEILGRAHNGEAKPLGVCSANLDHIQHFGRGSRWSGTLDQPGPVEWLTLLDGAPLVAEAGRITGSAWPRLAGSDLVGPLLDQAVRRGLRVGFLGGSPQSQELIRNRFSQERPGLAVAGWWAPERSVLGDVSASSRLAAEIAASEADILVVGLGKPRQELWIAEYGQLTGAKVLLAFGAVVDFLAGRITRAPVWVSTHGMEWAWRLMLEPRRLARRYLVDGPQAYFTLRMSSTAALPSSVPGSRDVIPGTKAPAVPEHGPSRGPGSFLPAASMADVAVIVVTYNNADDVQALVSSLRGETKEQSLKVVVADNSPDDLTMAELARHPDVVAVSTGGNLGYAGGINAAMRMAGAADAYLILNPDLRVEPGAVAALRRRMALSGAGMVVPVLLDDDGSVYPSLRREPGVLRALGDAALGGRVQGRPGWLSEMDFDPESYHYAHCVDWATGAALLIRADATRDVGDWDEQFFLYSEETDYCRRVRETGRSIWFEPSARMWHERGGSGTSPQLTALMSVNRVRYAAKYCGRRTLAAFTAAVLVSELVRLHKPGHRGAALAVLDRRRWQGLPHATRGGQSPVSDEPPPSGAVIIPAHNEAAVIARTLESLKGVMAWGSVEVIVACNGCTDGTEAIASTFPGVRVLSLDAASKTEALNAADQATNRWPRLYLDADIEVSTGALESVLKALDGGPLLAARPAFRYDTRGASALVRSYYRARSRVPGNAQGLWGAGAYALSRDGHDRLGAFPALTGDDYYVDRLFAAEEKAVLPTEPVVVRTPRTRVSLLAVLRRSYRGNAQQDGQDSATTSRTVRELLSSVRGPFSAVDAAVYAVFAAAGRRRPLLVRKPAAAWERDDSSR
ncbi:WecB/TagA/CpsF family glycosyltransferase [Paenarthrobacter sp. A20]|uniref:WecB/TagA/CpsF family glycosyltransferase n=1 Tax=Paenarthrobacter sp. A20 TaxID=2817891 RepID=UPI00209EE511|nr:WecB/TagA/CpsF family glycosyltransferase [Paenarthrobacter sp. A20]MCP1414119.1 exopolysaccharide biosynthesis WecB/TagA/CpsF family protein [Paenarthrobacter sp. A20]